MEEIDGFEGHISPLMMRGWVQDQLLETQNRAIEEHLESCESCAQILEILLQEKELLDKGELKNLLDNINPPQPGEAASVPCYLQTGQKIGPYTLVRRIGVGGMGEVWLADQREPIKRKVAIKLVKAGLDSVHMLERFNLERRSLARLDHPQIAKILDAGSTEQGQPFFTMQWCPGEPIDEYCKQHNLSAHARIELIAQVCDAIQHAHHKGVIHRDLKPSNILVAEEDGKPVVKVIDFGIAKLTMIDDFNNENGRATIAGQVLGTPCYMSPEQSSNGELDVDSRTDIYSLGIILYELLTGELPKTETGPSKHSRLAGLLRLSYGTTGSNTNSIFSNASIWRETGKNFYSTLNHDVEIIAAKARAKDRELRYGTPSELAADLRRYLRFEPIEARPPSGFYHVRRFCQRHLALVSLAALATTALITTTAISIDFALAAEKANFRAKIRLQEAIETREKAHEDRRSAELASRRATEIKDDTQYLTNMFSNALIIEGIQRNKRASTSKEILDTFSRTIELDLPNQPKRKAKLLGTIASHYEAIAAFEEAKNVRDQRLALFEEQFEPNSDELLLEKLRIFFCLTELKQSDAALELLRDVRKGIERSADRALTPILSSYLELATLLTDGKLQGAELIDRLYEGYGETSLPAFPPEVSMRYAHAILDVVFESGETSRMYVVDSVIQEQLCSSRTPPNFKLFSNIQKLIEYAHFNGDNERKKKYRLTYDLAIKAFSGEVTPDYMEGKLYPAHPVTEGNEALARAYQEAKRLK